ncbi:SH3 domain-containing protein [Clostridium thermobutyricum]|uniref:SH3 domain-containing protein n=1 Tax=Clostridium thermobutyricum TaxID=29372 RepID=UPI0018A9A368|nr:SH3 domain-containing protein [Clostridium thermobutyricum]
MKKKKIAKIIATSMLITTTIISTPTLAAFAETTTVKHSQEQNVNEVQKENGQANTVIESSNKENSIQNKKEEKSSVNETKNDESQIANKIESKNENKIKDNKKIENNNKSQVKKSSESETIKVIKDSTKASTTKKDTEKAIAAPAQLIAINLKTGKIVNKTEEQKREAINNLAVKFTGYDASSTYNNDNIHQLKNAVSFSSKTNEKLYNYMLSANNRWKAQNEAINLHGGDVSNTCVFFLSSALRAIGVPIPTSTGYCGTLKENLQSLGWTVHYDLKNLKPGDVCFASNAHVYTFMGWANAEHTDAWVADNQFTWYGSNIHVRDTRSNKYTDPTTCYYTAPGEEVNTGGNPNENVDPNYSPYGIGTVNVNGLNVRSEMSTSSQILGVLNYGYRVQIWEDCGDWYKINYNGRDAYVWKAYVTGHGPEYPNSVHITNQYPIIGTGIVDFKGGPFTYITCRPDWNNSGVGKLYNGTKVSITGESGNWYRINYKDGSAWICKDRVDTSLNKNDENKPEPEKEIKVNISYKTNYNDGKTVENSFNKENIDFTGEYSKVLTANEAKIPTGYNVVKTVINGIEVPYGSKFRITKDKNIQILNNSNEVVKEIKNNNKDKNIDITYVLRNKFTEKTGVVDFKEGPFTYITCRPDWNNSGVGQLYNGTEVKIVGESGNWYQIVYGNGTAWICKDRVNTSVKKIEKTGVVDFKEGPFTYITCRPDWNNSGVGQLYNGTEVKIVGESGNWYQIVYGNRTAWICKDRVDTSVKKIEKTGVVDFKEGPFTYITCRPDWNNSGVGQLYNGTEVKIVGESGNWYEISYGNGTAWICKDRVDTSVKKIEKTGVVDFKEGPFTYITCRPDWNNSGVGQLYNGTGVKIVGESGNWYQIVYGNRTAWICKDRVKIS